ncbi:MAG: hypothetical protein F2519_05965 [Actinobacteria bacterium]|uniref:Unannotated protein n=1 Tax=freshwater metagenome TaxID=449393 RepID=A0A6J7KXZ7_9ZZZZ|nr:hypothetical protein [Actinomycetota bacterium]MSW15621.1 hypothetical protein [Actinomycetota bacterium]MTA05102.1 hypothetical protein [Actinomycetota bacterium]MTA23220.1 hypothetical protein [Actinomycetota bacterium]
MSSLATKLPAKPIKGPGLTTPGVVILQFLLISLLQAFELQFLSDANDPVTGFLTGLAIIAAFAGGLYLGRTGTAYASAVNPPIAYFIATVILLITIGGTGFHPTSFGPALIKSLAKDAPFLIIGAIIGWGGYFARRKATT